METFILSPRKTALCQIKSVQLKCYLLLKLVKKDILQSWIKEQPLSFYHCKTCMLYMMENTNNAFYLPGARFTKLFMIELIHKT